MAQNSNVVTRKPHLTVKPLNADTDTDKEPFVKPIARGYINSRINVKGNAVKDAYRTMATVNEQLYNQIDVPVSFQNTDPYEDYEDMKESVRKEHLLCVYSGGSNTDYLSKWENLQGRAVHDWYGHLANDCNFSVEGEVTKWYNSIDHYPPEVCQILFAEVVAQVCVVHAYGWDSLEQRSIAAPSDWITRVCDYYQLPYPEGYDYHDVAVY